jgi:hypothetical protein
MPKAEDTERVRCGDFKSFIKAKAMKINFENRMEAIDWIAEYAEDEGQFEVLREQLSMNYILSGAFFLELDEEIGEVVFFSDRVSR